MLLQYSDVPTVERRKHLTPTTADCVKLYCSVYFQSPNLKLSCQNDISITYTIYMLSELCTPCLLLIADYSWNCSQQLRTQLFTLAFPQRLLFSALTVPVSAVSEFAHHMRRLRKPSIYCKFNERSFSLPPGTHPVFCFLADISVLFSCPLKEGRK